MNPELKQKWVEALRSGKYLQGDSCLRNHADMYCCLGVLCDVVDPNGWIFDGLDEDCYSHTLPKSNGFLPPPVEQASGLDEEAQQIFSKMNDFEQKPFPEIADYIEANL